MRLRLTGSLFCMAIALGVLSAPAAAHPLGNFSINHLSAVSVSRDAITVRYVLDQAEIPTFQERGLSDAKVIARKEGEVLHGLTVTQNGRPVQLTVSGMPVLSHPPGQAGLPLTRLVLDLRGAISSTNSTVRVDDGTFPGRVGWKAVVIAPGSGTAVRSSVPASDPTDSLRHYPASMLSTPLDQRVATLAVAPGHGTINAPRGPSFGPAATATQRSGDGFASVFSQAASGRAALVLLLLLAFGWGAAHALSPGHGKSMVAAYLVGTRGRPRHALALGATVTVAHTAGVFALGFVTLALSAVIVPERLYPWLNLASGLLVIGVGATVLRGRVRHARAHAHGHEHHHHDHDHAPDEITTRSLIALGASAGVLPCPSALVVLLAAISQHRIGLGLLLITAFSLGLAACISGLGLIVVLTRRGVAGRLSATGAGSRVLAALPVVSTLAILCLGMALTIRAIPTLG
jgi:ABC-type nickel/cobalt efflux system permease component RcnA